MYDVCMRRYNLYLTEMQMKLLKILSEDGLSISEHIRVAVNQYLYKNEKKLYAESSSKKGGGKND